MTCPCPIPRPNDPDGYGRKNVNHCRACGLEIAAEWSSGDATVREFFDRLARALPVRGDAWQRFRLHAEARERAGRPRFGQTFHGRDNLAEGMEEAADLALYSMLDVLKARRAGEHGDADLALTAAWHAFKGYESLLLLREKRRGAP